MTARSSALGQLSQAAVLDEELLGQSQGVAPRRAAAEDQCHKLCVGQGLSSKPIQALARPVLLGIWAMGTVIQPN